LREFRKWLRGQEPGVRSQGSEEFGLAALADEFTALRHEVKLLTKATRAQNEQLSAATGGPGPAADHGADRTIVQSAVEAVDTLDRALAGFTPQPRRWFARRDDRATSLAEGVRLSRQRIAAA